MKDNEKIALSKLKPYEKNARTHSEKQIEMLVNSIREFGFIPPVIIDENNVILAGHGRVEAAERVGLDEIPYRRITHLTDEQKKAFILADNKLSDLGGWDFDLLSEELAEITLDMGEFGFDNIEPIDFELDIEDDEPKENERMRTNNAYNLGLIDYDSLTNDFWQMPIIRNNNYIPKDLIGFNYAKTTKNKNAGVHFYIDDYQFERIWNYPEKYIDVLIEYDCILSPDFSLYMDMPMPMKIWNTYRSRQIGAYYQSKGITVIPTISWAEADTFNFCFKGIPKGSIVSISTIGVKRSKEALQIWRDGVTEMIRQIEPSAILIYGGKIDYDYGDIETYYYDNKVTEKFKKEQENVKT